MKKFSLILVNFLIISQLSTAQSVTLATTTNNPTAGTVVYNNSTHQLQYWNGTAWIPITNAASGTGWAVGGNDIYSNNSGNVGIGSTASTPTNKLQIGSVGGTGFAGNDLAIGNGSNAFGIYQSGLTVALGSTTNMVLKPGYPSGGYVGINVDYPDNMLQIGSVGFTNFRGNDLAIGNGTNAMAISQNNVTTVLATTTDIVLRPRNNGTGYVGISADSPTNKLQIGSVGSSGFTGKDFAIGNGTNAMSISQNNFTTVLANTTDIVLRPRNNGTGYVGISADSPTNKLQIGAVTNAFVGNDLAIGNGINTMSIYQSNVSTKISSTTDIYLNPRNNGAGRVGINTETPRFPLEVAGNVSKPGSNYRYYNASAVSNYTDYCQPCDANVSIFASNAVYAAEFDAYSDARIKDIIGVSNSAKDLETIKALEITDYTMKDKIQKGNKPFKKVIAQQVEKFYPQAVSQSTEVVPDIYALAEKIAFDESKSELTISLPINYNIKVGEKIQFIHAEKGKIKVEVVAVSGNSFTVKDWKFPTDKLFVYGREVNDFRTVDYEAISMLGISAIQQLAKEVEELKSQNNKLKADFSARLEAIEALLIKPQSGK